MPEPKAPGEPGYDPDRWFQHVVNVGLRLAREAGTGLPLVNALRRRFVGVAQSILGAAATILGQGIRAAARWMLGGPEHTVDLDTLPVAPKGFFGPEEVNRIVGLVDVPGSDVTSGAQVYHTDRINWPEDWSKAAIEDAVEAAQADHESDSPGMGWDVDKQAKEHMLWIGKKY